MGFAILVKGSTPVETEYWNPNESDSTYFDFSGTRITGKYGITRAQSQTLYMLVGNGTAGVADKVYYEFEIIKNIVLNYDGIRLGWGNDFYNSGGSAVAWYDSQGNSQTQSGMATFGDGDIVRVAATLFDIETSAGVDANIWYAVNGGGWQGSGSPNPVTGTDPTVGPLNFYFPMAINAVADAPYYNGQATELRLLAEPGNINYSPPSGFTVLSESSRFYDVLRHTDGRLDTVGFSIPGLASLTVNSAQTYRSVIPSSQLSNGPGSKISVRIATVGTGQPRLGEVWLGHKGTGTYDFDGNQVQLTFNNGLSAIFPAQNHQEELWSDQINFNYDDTKDLVISFYVSGTGGCGRNSTPMGGAPAPVRRSGNYADDNTFSGYSPAYSSGYELGVHEIAIIE